MANSKKEIETRLNLLIAEELGIKPEEVTPEARFIQDLGADSIEMVMMLIAVEEEFDIDIPDSEVKGLATVESLHKHILEALTQEA